MRRNMDKMQNVDVLPMATAQKVKTMIIQREMKPGDRLPTEKELTEVFGVSRSTLREAMKYLRAENVVVIRQGSGTFVSAGTGIGEDPLGLHFTDQKYLIQNLFETRMLIEPQIAGLAVQRATPQDIKNLERLVAEMDQIQINSTATAEMDVQFHTAVAKTKGKKDLLLTKPVNPSLSRASTMKSGSSFFVDLLG